MFPAAGSLMSVAIKSQNKNKSHLQIKKATLACHWSTWFVMKIAICRRPVSRSAEVSLMSTFESTNIFRYTAPAVGASPPQEAQDSIRV